MTATEQTRKIATGNSNTVP